MNQNPARLNVLLLPAVSLLLGCAPRASRIDQSLCVPMGVERDVEGTPVRQFWSCPARPAPDTSGPLAD